MNYQDSSSDDVPYLPPEQYQAYQSQTSLSKLEQRRGRSYFTADEIEELDSPSGNDNPSVLPRSTIPRPTSQPDIFWTGNQDEVPAAHVQTKPNFAPSRLSNLESNPNPIGELGDDKRISWGRRVLGTLLIAIPAILFSVAAHFIYTVSDFQLFSISFFIFQGVFWPCFGIIFTDLFCMPTKQAKTDRFGSPTEDVGNTWKNSKWILAIWTLVHSNLSAAAVIFQILSIQHLNISVSLALSFGFDVVVILIRYISDKKRCSWELLILSLMAYCGYGIAAIPAFVSSEGAIRKDTAIGVSASVGVMLLAIPSSLLLTHLRRHNVRDSVLGTSFAFFGCIQALVTKGVMGSAYNLSLDGRSVGWVAGIISVTFLGTIFLFLDARLSGLIWRRDVEENETSTDFSSITRTRIAVFILSCLWELVRQGFTNATPDPFDITGGLLVMISFLFAFGFQAWDKSYTQRMQAKGQQSDPNGPDDTDQGRFCAFIPWLFYGQKMNV